MRLIPDENRAASRMYTYTSQNRSLELAQPVVCVQDTVTYDVVLVSSQGCSGSLEARVAKMLKLGIRAARYAKKLSAKILRSKHTVERGHEVYNLCQFSHLTTHPHHHSHNLFTFPIINQLVCNSSSYNPFVYYPQNYSNIYQAGLASL